MIHLGKLSACVLRCKSNCVELGNSLPQCPSFSYRSILCLFQHSFVQVHIGDDVFIKKLWFWWLSEGSKIDNIKCLIDFYNYGLSTFPFLPIFKFSLNDLSETHNIDVYISLYVKTIYNEISMRNASPLMRDSFMIVLLHKINYKLNSDTHSQFTYETTIMLEGQQKIKGYGRRNCHPKSALKPAQQLLLFFFFFWISSLFRSMG